MIGRRVRVLALSAILVAALIAPSAALAFSPDSRDPADDAYTGSVGFGSYIADFAQEPTPVARSMAYGTVGEPISGVPAPACDQDWFDFYVTGDDLVDQTSFVIEVDAKESTWLPIIELYGPGGAVFVSPSSNPAAIWDGIGGNWVDGWMDSDDEIGTGCFLADMGSKWHDDAAVSTLVFSPKNIAEAAGTYFFRVRPWGEGYSYLDAEGPYTVTMQKGGFTRLWGDNRIETAVRLSEAQYLDGVKSNPGSEFGTRVVVATGYEFADALSGSALAGAVSSPLLLTHPDTLSPETAAELTRLAARDVLILGGTAAVSDAVKAQIDALVPGSVTRIQGPDRVATANAVADYIHNEVGATTAFVADKGNFPDALSAAPLAALNNSPILLTDSDVADPRMLQTLTDNGIQNVVVLGGTSAISAAVETLIAGRVGGAGHVRRIQGADRYETSKNFAAWACGLEDHEGDWTDPGNFPIMIGTAADPGAIQPLDPNGIGAASGVNYPDALAGGVFAGHSFAPILLTRPDEMSPWICDLYGNLAASDSDFRRDVITTTGKPIGRSYLFGGTAAVADSVYGELEAASTYQGFAP